MSYFALQVVSGREMITKNAIEIAVRNHNRFDIKEIIVPSQIILELKHSPGKQIKPKTVPIFNSYVFINIETSHNNYQEMNGEVFQFLNRIPNIRRVLTQSINKFEIDAMLSKWESQDLTQFVIFKIVEEPVNDSILMKAKEIIEKNKVISLFKNFVQTLGAKRSQFSALRYEYSNNGFIVYSPFEIIIEALNKTNFTIGEFMKTPHKLLQTLTNYCYETYNKG